MSKYGVYGAMALGSAAGVGLSFVIPGLMLGAGIAIGAGAGLAIGAEGQACHWPWQSRSEDEAGDR